MKIRLAFLALCAVLLTACGYTSAGDVPGTDYPADYDQLWQELEESYPYLPFLEEQGLDVAGIRAEYRAQAEAAESLADFVKVLQRMCAAMGNFAHLGVVSGDMYDLYMSADMEEMEYLAPWRETLSAPKTAACYEALEGMWNEPSAVEDWPEVDTRWFADCKTAYFHFYTFNHNLIDRDRDVVTGFLTEHPDAENIIFDITGNPGGSTYYMEEVILAPFGGAYEWTGEQYLRSSALTRRYYFDSGGYDIQSVSDDGPDFAKDGGLTHSISETDEYDFGAESVSDARRWVLIDERVYSSSERFAIICKQTGWATLVGARTGGDGMGTDPVIVTLDSTGLAVRFSALAGVNPDGTPNAAYGTAPDFLPDAKTRESALSACLRLIRKENE